MKDSNLNIRIKSDLLEAAKTKAEEDNRTLTGYVTNLIKKDLKKERGNEMNKKRNKKIKNNYKNY